MIRVILRFLGGNSLAHIDGCTCEKIAESMRNGIYEVWLRCPSPYAVLEIVEDALNRGLMLAELEFLNGVRVKGLQLDLRILQELGQYDADVAEGVVVVEYCKRPSEWMNLLSLRRCRIDVEKRHALIELAKPVKISTLFDYGLKLLMRNRDVQS